MLHQSSTTATDGTVYILCKWLFAATGAAWYTSSVKRLIVATALPEIIKGSLVVGYGFLHGSFWVAAWKSG